MNERGMNIQYPYDVPMKSGNGLIGFWTMVGFHEHKDELLAQQKGGKSITLDGGEPPG